MKPSNLDPHSFDFGRYLNEKERQVIASPHRWKWIGTCLPRKVPPILKHRKKKWILDPAHCHTPPQRELLFALSGSSVGGLGNEIFPITPGTIILFDHHEKHGLEPIPGEKSLRHLWLHFATRDQMSTNIFSIDENGTASDMGLKVRIDSFVHLVFDAWSNCANSPASPLSETLLKSVLTTAFLEALGRPAREPSAELERKVVEHIESYIENHLSEPLTLNRLAKLAGYNPFSFHRLFKKHRKTTLHRFIMLARVTEARRLLIKGYNVESVAESVGLSSAAVFSRFFKSHAELPPSAWRKINRYDVE